LVIKSDVDDRLRTAMTYRQLAEFAKAILAKAEPSSITVLEPASTMIQEMSHASKAVTEADIQKWQGDHDVVMSIKAYNDLRNLLAPAQTPSDAPLVQGQLGKIDGGVQVVSVSNDAETWGNKLNDAAWAAFHAWDKNLMGPMTGAIHNNLKSLIRVAILEYLKDSPETPVHATTLVQPHVHPLTADHNELVAKWFETQRTDIPAPVPRALQAHGLPYVGVEGILNGGIQSGKGWAVGVTKSKTSKKG
jgi:hypothetical protein